VFNVVHRNLRGMCWQGSGAVELFGLGNEQNTAEGAAAFDVVVCSRIQVLFTY